MGKLNLPLGEVTLEKIKEHDLKIMTIKAYRDKYHPGTPVETISYWITKNYIHYFRPGRERFIVMTTESKSRKVNDYAR